MGWDGMGWDGMGWDGMGWDEHDSRRGMVMGMAIHTHDQDIGPHNAPQGDGLVHEPMRVDIRPHRACVAPPTNECLIPGYLPTASHRIPSVDMVKMSSRSANVAPQCPHTTCVIALHMMHHQCAIIMLGPRPQAHPIHPHTP
jgi:hypothetical protein